jgi:chemotaxis protein methyltransferase CheR
VTPAARLVASRLGIDVEQRRPLDLSGIGNATALATLPVESPRWQQVIARITVAESYFFRDRATLTVLARDVLPRLIADRRERGDLRLAIWSAGCARGEEPYTLAMLVHALLPDRAAWSVSIVGTDIDARSLEAARRGHYSGWALRDTPPLERARWFRRRGRRFELDPEIREMVTFALLNLAEDPYPSGIDLVVCRNVLIYFGEAARRAAIDRLREAVAPDGWLALGHAESSGEQLRPLTAVAYPDVVLYRREPTTAAVPTPRQQDPEPEPEPPAVPVPDPAQLLERARAHADRGRLDRALALCERALARDRLNPEAHLLAAAIHQERGELDRAIAASRSAVYLAPGSAAARFRLDSLVQLAGRPRAAG